MSKLRVFSSALAVTALATAFSTASITATGAQTLVAQANVNSPQQARRILRDRGYRNIRMIDRRGRRHVAEACRNGNKFRLVINRRGRVRNRRRLGSCGDGDGTRAINRSIERPINRDRNRNRNRNEPQAVQLSEIRGILRARGFNRISFTDRRLPRYKANACKQGRRFVVTLNRFGQITRRRPNGRCISETDRAAPKLQDVRNILRDRRYYRIRFTDRTLPGYAARACRNRKEFRLKLNRWGEIRGRRQVGVCGEVERGYFKKPRIRRRFDINALRQQERIYADDCQDYFEDLLEDNTINFAVSSARIGSDSYELLDKLAFVAGRCPETSIEIAGHTDSDGSRSSNQRLSERRATAVARYLFRNDVPSSRLRAVGYGEERPTATNETARGRQANRRIEFVVNWDG